MAKTIDSVKTPLFAAVGAGDLAVEAVGGFVKDIRGRAATAATDTQARAHRTREMLAALPSQVPGDLTELRARINPDDIRKQAETYLHNAAGTYGALAQRGESRIETLRKQPVVEARLSDAAEKTEDAIEELGKRSRLVREFANRTVGRLAARSEKAVDTVTAQATGAVEAVSGAANAAVAEAAEVRDAVADRVADIADETRETLASTADDAADATEDAVADVKDAAEEVKAEAKPDQTKKAPTRRTATKRTGTTASRRKSTAAKSEQQ
ncbi:hypothetical protein ONR57_08530 [Hoyosella sp. YIM 151337]|uniref:hypothetical protein n=1 Tax=Hoyosella sp. YIM 151337 TaxID=2992742 RepID=UPI002235923D|nr:hypothetical protein [Hoyosella sp. YIM 151337]MCW4353340.1 hypothetical protein [Hoyosella sp. YIM 151337]